MSSEATPQVKGSNVRLAVKALRANRDRVASHLPPHLQRYLVERILPGSWYPEADQQELLGILCTILPVPPPERWRFIGREAADDHANGLYAGLVSRGPAGFFSVFASLWRLLHTTGEWQVESLGPTSVRASLSDFAVGMPEYGPLMEGYLSRVLERCGAGGVTVVCLGTTPDGATWQASWEPDGPKSL